MGTSFAVVFWLETHFLLKFHRKICNFNLGKTPMARVFFIFAFIFAPALASAQEQKGIAFAYAPEQGYGVCTGSNPDKAFACARQKCADSGAAAEDCARVAWCFPSGWTAAVGILHKEGLHWTEYSCGWETREAAAAAAKIRCDTATRPFIQECSASLFYDPDGNEIAE